jgi:DNA repair protein RadC
MEHGPGALTDAELLAVLIGSGSRGRSAVDVGRDLLLKFGSLRGLLTADRKEWLQQSGIGPVRSTVIQAALELARRNQLDQLRAGVGMSNPNAMHSFLLAQLRDLEYEVFCCVHLDSRLCLIAFEELFRGTIDEATVHPREVVRQVLLHNASVVVFAHNHPSGVAEPSLADEVTTRRLKNALELINVRVLDHIVIGEGVYVSFAERGLL